MSADVSTNTKPCAGLMLGQRLNAGPALNQLMDAVFSDWSMVQRTDFLETTEILARLGTTYRRLSTHSPGDTTQRKCVILAQCWDGVSNDGPTWSKPSAAILLHSFLQAILARQVTVVTRGWGPQEIDERVKNNVRQTSCIIPSSCRAFCRPDIVIKKSHPRSLFMRFSCALLFHFQGFTVTSLLLLVMMQFIRNTSFRRFNYICFITLDLIRHI